MIADVTMDNELSKSFVLDRVDRVTDHTQDVKTRQDRLRQVNLNIQFHRQQLTQLQYSVFIPHIITLWF